MNVDQEIIREAVEQFVAAHPGELESASYTDTCVLTKRNGNDVEVELGPDGRFAVRIYRADRPGGYRHPDFEAVGLTPLTAATLFVLLAHRDYEYLVHVAAMQIYIYSGCEHMRLSQVAGILAAAGDDAFPLSALHHLTLTSLGVC